MSLSTLLEPNRRWMRAALSEAERALEKKEAPIGAVVTRGDHIIGRGHNLVESLRDPTAHAEIIAITAACESLRSKRLEGCSLYVTLEPCPMCAGAIVLARLDRLVFGAFDPKAGSASSLYNIPQDTRLNHRVEIISGVEEESASHLLTSFFQARRARPGKEKPRP